MGAYWQGHTPCAAVVPDLIEFTDFHTALADAEQQTVLATLHDPRYVDLAPPQVYAQLLEDWHYLCSIRTMYPLLVANYEDRERRAVASHVVYTGQTLNCGKLLQIDYRRGSTDASCGLRLIDEIQGGCPVAVRPGHHEKP